MKAGFFRIFAIAAVILFTHTACDQGGGAAMDPDFSQYPQTLFTISDESKLIGGPTAQGAIGDVLLENDRIRVIIQKPRKNAGLNSFGGIIIDADLVRPQGEPGQDNFGSIFPLVNVEWTVNYYNYEVISDGTGGSPKALRAYGKIDVYDYLDLDFIGDVAEGIVGQRLHFSNRFDDRRNPFNIYDDLKGMSGEVITDYTLEEGKSYVRIDTTYTNEGKEEVKLPLGQFINGSGHVSMLIPGMGFSPDLMTQVSNDTPAIIYAGFDDVDISYGYFYDAGQFVDPEANEPYITTSVSYSGLTGLLLGEEFLKLTPLGQGGSPEIHTSIPAQGSRTITGYFVVGNGSAGSVLDSGLKAVGTSTRSISGTVADSTGSPVAGATVAVISGSGTLITYRTDENGHFSGRLPAGGDAISRRFGKGQYMIEVDVPGYHLNGTQASGSCEPHEIDLTTQESAHVVCTLGETGSVALASPVIDAETGRAVPARLTIVGEDPSPNKIGASGRFRSTIHWEPIFGIADVKYITALGTFDLTGSNSFDLEPGTYLFVVSRGPEYTADERLVDVPAGGTVTLEGIEIRRAVATPGYISADFHIHSVVSPDSNLSQELRALSAAAEALDVLQSSDHDYLTDYAPVVSRLMSQGIIPPGSMQTSVGDEVTPNHYGHIHAFPLVRDDDDPEGGAVDWSYTDRDEVSPAPDYVLPIDQLIQELRADPGEEVIQINHIMDNPTGILVAAGWVTSPYYMKDFDVAPLSAYADPVERRMSPAQGLAGPYPLGSTELVTTDFDAAVAATGGATVVLTGDESGNVAAAVLV